MQATADKAGAPGTPTFLGTLPGSSHPPWLPSRLRPAGLLALPRVQANLGPDPGSWVCRRGGWAGGSCVGARPAVQMHFMLFPEVRQSTADSCWPDSPAPCPPLGLSGHPSPPHPCPKGARKRQGNGPQAALPSVHGAVRGPSGPWHPDFADVR